MRIPLAVSLESRDGTVRKDAFLVNGIAEKRGDALVLRKRPGISDNGLVKAGAAQLLVNWNGLNVITGDYLSRGSISTITSAPVQTNLSPSNAGLQFTSAYTTGAAATPRLFFKNRTQGWVVNRAGTITGVTYASSMGAGTYNLISLTRSGGTATATLAEDIFNVGDSVTIAGATPVAYNGTFTITAVTAGSSTPAMNVPISSLTRSGTTATAVTPIAHGLTNGASYAISGANETAYNGTKTVTVTSTSSFTYTVTVTTNTATFDPAFLSTTAALTGGNLTITHTSASISEGSTRATISKSSGKWYWEVSVVTNSTQNTAYIGVAGTGLTTGSTDYVGKSSDGWGYSCGGLVYNNAVATSGFATFDNAIIGVALDLDSGTLAFYKNGVLQTTVAGVSGTLYPAVTVGLLTGGHDTATVNFGATAFTYSVPSGFQAYSSDSPASPATGSPIVTVPGTAVNPTFSYTVAGSPATPATGTITAQGTGGTVPGIAYIDGTFFVMDTNGIIWASGDDNPTSWAALDFAAAAAEPGSGRALGKSQNYLIALKEWSTEPYANAAGAQFPFAPVQGGNTLVGCASGDSLAEVDGNLLWLAQSKYATGRSVYLQRGLQQQKVSTPDVERILNRDSLATIYAYGLNLDGHPIYILTLATFGVTLAYDLSTQVWSTWTTMSLGSSKSVSSITRSNGIATVTTATAHGLAETGAVLIAGANQNEYNGVFPVHVVSTTVFQIPVDGTPLTPATGTITATPYSSSYFKFTKSANYNGTTLLLHESDGHLYQFSTALYRDNGAPIDLIARTTDLDGQTLNPKRMASLAVVASSVADYCTVFWSDDDATTFSNCRFINLSDERPETRRCGAFRRRIIQLRYLGNASPVFEALELDIK